MYLLYILFKKENENQDKEIVGNDTAFFSLDSEL